MNMNLTDNERSRMGNANLDALCNHLEFLMDNPEAIADIQDGSTITLVTTDDWVNDQNQKLQTLLESPMRQPSAA